MERYAVRHGIDNDVRFLGMLPRRELAELYGQADLFVIASIRESFCIAALEARCAGLPVIALKGSGSAEFLRDSETALLARDDEEFAHHWARLARDDSMRRLLTGTDTKLDCFSWPAVTDAHIAVYSETARLARSFAKTQDRLLP
jgi:glycosyltransferase involved in cell wall biosynthesis